MTNNNDVWPGGQPATGQRAQRTRKIEARDIELFTAISGDRNPLHYDEEVARATKFGGIIVQGGITSAILNAVVAEELPGPGTVFLQVNWSFKAPVRPGDEITGMARFLTSAPTNRSRSLRLQSCATTGPWRSRGRLSVTRCPCWSQGGD